MNKKLFKTELLIIFFAIFCSVIYISILYINSNKITILDDISKFDLEGNCIWNIDQCEMINDILYIEGYFFKENENIELAKEFVVLKNINNNKYYKIPTTIIPRDDVNNLYDNTTSINYTYSGFSANVKRGELSQGDYEICILYQSSNNNILKNLKRRVKI